MKFEVKVPTDKADEFVSILTDINVQYTVKPDTFMICENVKYSSDVFSMNLVFVKKITINITEDELLYLKIRTDYVRFGVEDVSSIWS